ncbi:hypothetical protein D3C71_1677710 [compost metagenome]
MDQRDRERQPLAHTERQSVRQSLHYTRQIEALRQFLDTTRNAICRHAEKLGVQLEVLQNRELGIKREGL